MSCEKGGFVSIKHNNLRALTAKIVSEGCKDTKIESKLLPLSGKKLHRRTTNRSNKERLDIRASGFWERGRQAFFDLRVFDLKTCIKTCRYLNKSLQEFHAMNEPEKKRSYNQRVVKVDH